MRRRCARALIARARTATIKDVLCVLGDDEGGPGAVIHSSSAVGDAIRSLYVIQLSRIIYLKKIQVECIAEL